MNAAVDPFRLIQDLYHFTDERNLPKIKESGGLLATGFLRDGEMDYVSGGDTASLALDREHGWDRYVHLCFTENHPMAFHVARRAEVEKLRYLQIDRRVVYEEGVLFATGIAYAQGVETVTLAQACERGLIDFRALYERTDWNDPGEWQKRHAAEKCEILVPTMVAIDFIKNLPNG